MNATYPATPLLDDSECDYEPKVMQIQKMDLVDNVGNPGRYSGRLHKTTQVPHGQGRMEYADKIYEGQWVMGDWSGYGKLYNTLNADSYEGGFFDNMKHGSGVIKYADGRIYDGAFQFDRMGKGKMKYLDGSSYWGYWNEEGLRHGRGKFIYTDGTIYDGEFQNGEIEGHGRLTRPDGGWYLGEFSQGQPNGLGLEVLPGGQLHHEGNFYDGKPLTGSSFRRKQMSTGSILLYPSECGRRGSLEGPMPRKISLRRKLRMSPTRIMFFPFAN